jgi:ABC-type dipeptide/oligopeptide/nickel transport system permease subunit
MTVALQPLPQSIDTNVAAAPADTIWRQARSNRRVVIGGGILLFMLFLCIATLPLTLRSSSSLYYDRQDSRVVRFGPFTGAVPDAPIGSDARRADFRPIAWMGYDMLGRSIFARCLLGGTISLAVGIAAATISVVLGVGVGLLAGYRGGLMDSALMRIVDVLYGLPYILLVVLFKIAFENKLQSLLDHKPMNEWFGPAPAANMIVLFMAIGLVSWLTMARVVRGQVLSIRSQPYIEACRAIGLPQWRIFMKHILPNLVGPITVYATLTVPSAILQESFLSFLGVGVNPPMPTWGSLASDGVAALSPLKIYWWMLVFPCLLLVVTLLSLNFVGDGLRDVFDPKREAAKI